MELSFIVESGFISSFEELDVDISELLFILESKIISVDVFILDVILSKPLIITLDSGINSVFFSVNFSVVFI